MNEDKNCFFFPHDTDSIQDPKMITLLHETGPFGVGLYWIVIEIMHSQWGRIGGPLLDSILAFYGRQGAFDDALIAKTKEVLFATKLLLNDGENITSDRVDYNLKRRIEIANRGRENAMKRWGNNANPMPPQCQPNAIKERKGKKRKEEDPPKPPEGFDLFWREYPKKVGKDNALKAWRKIQPLNGLIEKIVAALISQREANQWTKSDPKFIPHPSTWLNGKRWEDEIFKPEKEPMPEWKQKQLDHIRRQATESELKTN